MEKEDSNNSARADSLRQISSILLGVASLCFVIGLLIVNIRLVRYGIYSVSFARTEYILVGASCLFMLAFVRVVSSYGVSTAKSAGHALLGRNYILASAKAIASILFLVFVPVLALLFLCNFSLDILRWNIWIMLAILFLGNHWMDEIYSGLLGIGDPDNRNPNNGSAANNRASRLIDILLPLLYFAMWLTLYAYYVYPNVSPAVGGGYRDKVLLAPTKMGKAVFRTMGLPFAADSMIVGPIEILTESQDEVVLLPPSDLWEYESYSIRAIRVKKTMIDATINVAPKRLRKR